MKVILSAAARRRSLSNEKVATGGGTGNGVVRFYTESTAFLLCYRRPESQRLNKVEKACARAEVVISQRGERTEEHERM